MAIALAACSGPESDGPSDSGDHTPSAPVPSSAASRATEPDVVGAHPGRARSILRDAGYRVIVHQLPERGCNVMPQVVEQHISRRRNEPAQIWVTVDALSCGLTEASRGVAEGFIAFARHESDSPPAIAPVNLYVGGRRATTIERSRLDDPAAWQGCPAGQVGYAARTCPLSALGPILELRPHQGPLQITASTPDLPCGPVQQTPRELTSRRYVAISGGSSCADSFAITLFLDADHQIVAVDVAWSEP